MSYAKMHDDLQTIYYQQHSFILQGRGAGCVQWVMETKGNSDIPVSQY